MLLCCPILQDEQEEHNYDKSIIYETTYLYTKSLLLLAPFILYLYDLCS